MPWLELQRDDAPPVAHPPARTVDAFSWITAPPRRLSPFLKVIPSRKPRKTGERLSNPTREFPRLCRGGSSSLTFPAVARDSRVGKGAVDRSAETEHQDSFAGPRNRNCSAGKFAMADRATLYPADRRRCGRGAPGSYRG